MERPAIDHTGEQGVHRRAAAIGAWAHECRALLYGWCEYAELLILDYGILIAAVFALSSTVAYATNGLNHFGFGTESVMMGGADVAVARDTTALNTNPAGLRQLSRPAFDVYSATAYSLDVGHRDPLNDARVSNHFVSLGGGGYARPLGHGLVAGIGLFAQGGAGNIFRNVNTGLGTNDELSSQFGIGRINAGLAWQAGDKLSLGASIGAIYSRIEQKIFPNTSVAAPTPFFGLKLKGVDGINFGLKFGAQYVASERWTLGATFTPKARLTMSGGSAVVNMTATGLGAVTYRDAHISGFALPREAAAGAAWQATDRLLISAKVGWLNWADALKSSTLTLTAPNNGAAPASIESTATLNWKNQTVYALGTAYAYDNRTTLRAGFNYGANPVPAQNMNPLLAAISVRHWTAGASRRLAGGWELGAGFEYQPGSRVRYSNPQAPLGVNAEERNKYLAAHFMLSRRW